MVAVASGHRGIARRKCRMPPLLKFAERQSPFGDTQKLERISPFGVSLLTFRAINGLAPARLRLKDSLVRNILARPKPRTVVINPAP